MSQPDITTPIELLEFARVAYRNAKSLASDAALLLKHRRHPRAASLAIIGIEEAGKALILCLVGMRQSDPKAIEDLLSSLRRRHFIKQALGKAAHVIGDLEQRVGPILHRAIAPALRRQPPPRTLDDLGRLVTSVLTPDLLADIGRRAQTLTLFAEEVRRVLDGEWQKPRDAGFYVDFDKHEISAPTRIKREEARLYLQTLRTVLRGVRRLIPVTELNSEDLRYLASGAVSQSDPEPVWAALIAGATSPTKTDNAAASTEGRARRKRRRVARSR